MRTSPILGLLICSAIIVNVANAKPIFIKVFAPSSGYSYQTTPTAAPANTQFISNLISQKIQLLTNFLQAKSSLGNSFGFTKTFTFNGPATTTTTTTSESPVITHSTEKATTTLRRRSLQYIPSSQLQRHNDNFDASNSRGEHHRGAKCGDYNQRHPWILLSDADFPPCQQQHRQNLLLILTCSLPHLLPIICR
ncbi:hypothetical protein ACLKA6_017547 [Drosophila palustris]